MTDQEQKPEPALTQEQADKYIDDSGGECPFCGADQLAGGSCDYDSGRRYQRIRCTACDRHWVDGYTLDSILADGVDGSEPSGFLYRSVKPARIIIELDGEGVVEVHSSVAANVAVVDRDDIQCGLDEDDIADIKQLLDEAKKLKSVY